MSNSGKIFMTNGLKIQYKRVTNINDAQIVTLPLKFSNNDYIVMLQTQGTTSYANGFCGGDYNRQSNHQTLTISNSYSSFTGSIQIFAIGY